MKKLNQLFFALIATIMLIPLAAQAADFEPLITPQDLSRAQAGGDVLIIDIRPGQSDSGVSHFEEGHIKGSAHGPYNLFRGPQDNPGLLVSEDHLTDVLQDLGVRATRPTVIVHQGRNETDFGSAARVYWTLKSSGVSNLAILNGGVNAWQSAGYSLETGPGAPVKPSDFTVTFSSRWLATADDIKASLARGEDLELIDARPDAFWEGNAKHGAAPRPGTLPQSRNFVHSSWFSEDDPTLINPAIVPGLAESGGFEQGDEIVSFCNTGHWAATNWFVLSEVAGIEDVKLYPESVVGWQVRGFELANTPGAIRNLWNRVTQKY